MNVGFTGTQKGMTSAQRIVFRGIIRTMNITGFNHGDCVGADEDAHSIVRFEKSKIKIRIFPPVDEKKRAFCKGDYYFQKCPYLIRNKLIVNHSHILIVCPKEEIEQLRSGTWSTVRYAKKWV